jgi:hypothetical protein
MINSAKHALAALVVVAAFGAAFAKGGDARVRFLHASPDAPAVDILVNGGAAFEGLKFGEATPYAAVPAGEYDVQVVPEGLSSPVVIDLTGPNAVNLFYNRSYTAVALGTLSSIEPLLLADDNRPAPRQSARIRFVHASPDAPAVDIAVTGGPVLFKNVAFKGVGDYVTVPAGSYDLEVRIAGTKTVVLSLPGVMVEGGTTYSVFATGFAFSTPSLAPVVTVDAVNPSIGKGQGRGLDQ